MVTRAQERIAGIYADGWSRIVATMIRLTRGDWDLAEECAQDAFAQALQKWPESGVPDEPLAWLTTTARHRAIDRMRRASTEAAKLREVAAMQPDPPPYARDSEIPDERLELMFTCCHPSLNLDAQVALTLRSLAGMSTAEIARAFLLPERTMGQRLFRAKQKVAHAGIPFRVPPPHLLPERLPAVLHVLYLLFNEGYGHPGETRLAREAIRLARVLAVLMPDEPEAHGMLALMLLHDARRRARVDASGSLVTLDEQDRSLWDADQIAEGTAVLDRALRRHRAGPFQIQAAIAACHATAAAADQTDWPQIVGLYEQLARVAPSVIVDLNRAVAVGMADGPEAALPLVDAIARTGQLDGYYLLHATRADLLRRAGRLPEAAESYREAFGLAPTEAERRFLGRPAVRALTIMGGVDNTHYSLVVAAAQAAGPCHPGDEAAWGRRVQSLTVDLHLIAQQARQDIERLESARTFIAFLEKVEIEESSRRGLLTLRLPSGESEPIRTEQKDSDRGRALIERARSLEGRWVLVYRYNERKAGQRNQSVRMLAHLMDMGVDGAVPNTAAKKIVLQEAGGDPARAQEAWAAAGLPGTGPVSVDQLEQARAAARQAG